MRCVKPEEKISVIVPAYNIAPWIENCVRSIQKQNYKSVEIIVVNDGSTDRTAQILDSLSLQDPRIRVIHQENSGVTSARLAGVQIASGDWIGFIDGDDVIEPDMYERLLGNAHKYCADISHCGYQMVFPDRKDYYYNTGKIVEQNNETGLCDLLSGDFIEPGLCNKLYKRELFSLSMIDELMDRSIRNMEDLLMNYYLFKVATKSIYEDFCPYHYQVRKGSAATSAVNSNKLNDPQKVFHIIREDVIQNESLKVITTRRLAGCLLGLLIQYKNPVSEQVCMKQVEARRELKKLIPKLRQDKGARKIYVQSVAAVFWPSGYRFIYCLVGRISGSDQKYKV